MKKKTECVVEKDIDFVCPHCGQTYTDEIYFNKHLLNCLNNSNNRTCKTCAMNKKKRNKDFCMSDNMVIKTIKIECINWKSKK